MARTLLQQINRPGTYLPFYLPKWELQASTDLYKLIRTYEFPDELAAKNFAACVLQRGDHLKSFPSLHIFRRWVCVIIRVPNGQGLRLDDYILPTVLDELYSQWQDRQAPAA